MCRLLWVNVCEIWDSHGLLQVEDFWVEEWLLEPQYWVWCWGCVKAVGYVEEGMEDFDI